MLSIDYRTCDPGEHACYGNGHDAGEVLEHVLLPHGNMLRFAHTVLLEVTVSIDFDSVPIRKRRPHRSNFATFSHCVYQR